MEFVKLWMEVHQRAQGKSLTDIYEITFSLLDSHTLPMWEQFKTEKCLSKVEAWINGQGSLWWHLDRRGGALIPLELIGYEITTQDGGLLKSFLRRLINGEIQPINRNLFEYIFPILNNFMIPFDATDIAYFQAAKHHYQSIRFYSRDNLAAKVAKLGKLSLSTARRRIKIHNTLGSLNPIAYANLGKLDFESFLLVHNKAIPQTLLPYTHLSNNFHLGIFSIIQIPHSQPNLYHVMKDQLHPSSIVQLNRRITSWNLSSLYSDGVYWTTPPPLFYGEPEIEVITPSPDVDQSLILPPTLFRKLTPADIKLIDFLPMGSIKTLKGLSKQLKVSRSEITARLREYYDSDILDNATEFFKLGLDLSVFFFIQDDGSTIPWLSHLLTFPKVHVLMTTESLPHYYYGFVKLPPHWMKPFVRKMELLHGREEITAHHHIASALSYFQWQIPLSKTYPIQNEK
ncbi:MAG: hypothetical protein ACW98I_20685 [Candidatus Hodarchaeales archaeon]|jgi:hypothetical protein